MGPQTNSNNFFGIAVSQPGINVNQASPSQMLYTNDYSTTTWRDAKGNITLQEGLLSDGSYGLSAGGGNVELNSSGLSVTATNGTIDFGNISNSQLGMQVIDDTGYVLFEMTGQTWYWYDKTTNTNVMQVGLLPDGTYGMAVAENGYNVADGF